MKYRIAPAETGYELTLITENHQDHVILHDCIATKISKPSAFIGAVFMAEYAGFKSAKHMEGPVPLRDGLVYSSKEMTKETALAVLEKEWADGNLSDEDCQRLTNMAIGD